jgi:hypothetical protein
MPDYHVLPPIAKIAEALGGEVSGAQVLAPGPGHSAVDRSLSVTLDAKMDGGFVVHSFAGDDDIKCKDHVREKLGLPKWAPEKNGKGRKENGGAKLYSPTIAKYVYRTADGTPYLQVHRQADKSAFPQYHWDTEKWISGKPKGPKIPYRLPELANAAPGTKIWVCEGEKDCDNLAKLGFVATCNSEGAEEGSGKKFTSDLVPYFKDHHCYVLEDNDAKGRKHAAYVARVLDPVAASVRIVRLPGLPEKGDVSDWLQHDTAGARLIKEADRAPLWEPPADGDDGGDQGDDEPIAELAGLSALAYAKRRKDAAEKLGIGVGVLDKIVSKARGEAKPDEEWEVEPWPEEVATADLLRDLRETFSAHVILPEHGAAAMALWTLHAWTIDVASVSPFLSFTSPMMRCGKSTALMLLNRTGPRPALASNISPAAIFRYVEKYHPCLIIDEADSFVSGNEELRGILNSGHARDTAFVIRCDGEAMEPRKFSTWGPKAVACIGKLAATLQDRSIVISMRRRKPSERVTKLRARDTEAFLTLRQKAARWSADNIERLRETPPHVPETLNDRAADNWESLLGIADLAGGDWPKAARVAALELSADAAIDSESTKTQLLDDIRDIFAASNLEAITSKRLLALLHEDATKPWSAYGKLAKPITERQVARLLEDFKVYPRTIRRPGEKTARGYVRSSFVEAFESYLQPLSGSGSDTPTQSNDFSDLWGKRSDTRTSNVSDRNEPNPLETKECVGMSDRNPQSPATEALEAVEGPSECAHCGGMGGAGQTVLEDRTCAQCRGPVDGKEQPYSIGEGLIWLHPECQRFYLKERG